jgi:hypothetical protein
VLNEVPSVPPFVAFDVEPKTPDPVVETPRTAVWLLDVPTTPRPDVLVPEMASPRTDVPFTPTSKLPLADKSCP